MRKIIFVAQSLEPLPEKFFFTIKIVFNEKYQASDHQIPGFRGGSHTESLRYPVSPRDPKVLTSAGDKLSIGHSGARLAF
jgi:HORMA domain